MLLLSSLPPPTPHPSAFLRYSVRLFFSPPKEPCGKVLALETLAFSSCGKKELLFYGGLEAEEPPAARAAALMVSAISLAPAVRQSGQPSAYPLFTL